MKENNYCYSIDGELFDFDDIDEVVESIIDRQDNPPKVGDELAFFQGVSVEKKAGDYLPNYITEGLTERAWDDVGECAESWLAVVDKEDEKELEDALKAVVNEWADNKGLQPDFYGVSDVKEVSFRVVSESGDYEIIGCEK